jgi:CBS domain containing-hemolysin-like protein
MLPKSLAYSNSRRFCLAAAPICYIFVRLLAPLLGAFESVVVKPAVRLFALEPGREELSSQVNVNLLKELIESSRKEGLISKDENQLLLEILEFSHLKVRHVMRPRVDMLAAEVSESPANLRRFMHDNNVIRIPLYSGDIDNIVGMIHLRTLLLEPDKAAAEMLDKIEFVPEQKTVESLIELFQRSGTDMVIAVDEYGGIAGQVLLDDIVDELVGPILEKSDHAVPIGQIGPMEYRLAGDLAIHDWAHAFGIDPGKSRLATMGGLVASLLEKIPKPGDIAYMKNVKLTVEKVSKHRIESLIVTFESIGGNNSD